MALDSNPIAITQEGQSHADPCRIAAISWTGATSAGNTVIVTKRVTDEVVWQGWAAGDNTSDATPSIPDGIPCPHGFKVDTMDAGSLLVYLMEE